MKTFIIKNPTIEEVAIHLESLAREGATNITWNRIGEDVLITYTASQPQVL